MSPSRTALITALLFGLLFLTGAGFLLARALTGAGTERERVVEVIRAQARGDAKSVLELLPICAAEPVCERVTRARVAKLRRSGRVEVLKYDPSVQAALFNTTGVGRVAWRVGTGLPIVQCVRVRRKGPLSSERVELVGISDPKDPEASC